VTVIEIEAPSFEPLQNQPLLHHL